jgi:hypothetical protein
MSFTSAIREMKPSRFIVIYIVNPRPDYPYLPIVITITQYVNIGSKLEPGQLTKLREQK